MTDNPGPAFSIKRASDIADRTNIDFPVVVMFLEAVADAEADRGRTIKLFGQSLKRRNRPEQHRFLGMFGDLDRVNTQLSHEEAHAEGKLWTIYVAGFLSDDGETPKAKALICRGHFAAEIEDAMQAEAPGAILGRTTLIGNPSDAAAAAARLFVADEITIHFDGGR